MPTEPDNRIEENELINEGVRQTEQEIADAAWADKPPGQEPEGEQPQADEGDREQGQQQEATDDKKPLRNEKGQFVSAREQPDAAEGAEPEQQPAEGEQEQAEGDDERMPRWRIREIAEERRQAVARADALQAELIRMQTAVAQIQRGQQQPQQPGQQQEQLDPLLDPQGWERRQQAMMDERLRTMELNTDLRIAHIVHKETFEKAYEALLQTGQRDGGALIRQLVAQPAGAGERIVQWYRQQEMMQKTNGDLSAYDKKREEELLNNEEHLKKAIEVLQRRASGQQPGQQQQGQRPANITRLPPSLSRAPGGSPNSDPIDTDDSEEATFNYAFR